MSLRKSTFTALTGLAVLVAATAVAGQTSAPAAPARLAAPMRGAATVEHTRPVTKAERVNGQQIIITTIKVKNTSTGAIAGFKVDEFWYDAQRNPLPGDTYRHRRPMQPQEVITVELRTPRDPKMVTNSYNFSHANGTISAKLAPKL